MGEADDNQAVLKSSKQTHKAEPKEAESRKFQEPVMLELNLERCEGAAATSGAGP